MVAESPSNEVEVQERVAQPVLSIRGTIPVARLGETMGDRIPALLGYVQQGGARAAGPVFVRYHTFGKDETDMEIGIPVAEPVAGEGRIAAGELPAGPAIATWHIGAHNTLGEAYGRLTAWRDEQGRESDGPGWEVYCWIDPTQEGGSADAQDPSSWRTQLVQPIKAE
jgi:effector-binding domain-containing protein